MDNTEDSTKRQNKAYRNIARVISTAVAGFLLLFVVGYMIQDLSDGKLVRDWSAESTKVTVFVLLMALGTGIAWWREKIGGAILMITGLVAIVFIFFSMEPSDIGISLIFGFPSLLSGLLFLIYWKQSKT